MSGEETIRRAYDDGRVLSDGGGEKIADAPAPAKPKSKRKGGGGKGGGEEFSVEEINREFSLVLMGQRAIIMQQIEAGPVEERQRILSVEAFHVWFSNRITARMNARGDDKWVTWAKAWMDHPQRRSYMGVEFFPDPGNAPGTPGWLNLWRGFAFMPCAKANGYSVFKDHLLTNVCGQSQILYDWVFAFFAHLVQRPRERVSVALVLRGGMGSGKTVVGEHIGALFPAHYFLVDDPRYVTGQFNAHMASCLLLQADEAVWAGDKAAEGRLKGLVTAPTQQIEAKGVDPIRLKNYVRLLMTSNEGWVVPAGPDERRFCVLDVDPRCMQNGAYFGEMRAQLEDGGYAALLHDLLNFDLSRVDLRTIPKTEALLDQKERSLDSVPSWWLDRLVAGSPTAKAKRWEREIKRDELFNDYIDASDRIGVRRKREQTIFGREIRLLVPGIRDSRLMEPDGSRPRCYVLPGLQECRAAWDERMHQSRDWCVVEDESEDL